MSLDILDCTAIELGLDIKNYSGKWTEAKRLAFKADKRDFQEDELTPFSVACRLFLELGGERIPVKLSIVVPLQELRAASVKRCESSFKHSINDWTVSDWAMATTGELGELCNLLKKQNRGEIISKKQIADEIADTLIYLDLLAARLGIDLTEAIISKFNEVSERVGSDVKIGEF